MTQTQGIILIIDDNENVIKSIRGHLTFCGFQVVVATNAERALAVAGELKPSLVLLDLKMPGTNGVAFLKRYRAIEKEVPVILLTGFYDEFKSQITPDLKVYGYLSKRHYRKELEKMVYDALKKPESERTFSETAKGRILVVDDEPEITDGMKSFLQEKSFLVGTAGRAEEAMSLNKHFRADIIISDILLATSGMDGIDLVRELKKSEHPPKFYYFVTGVGDNQEMLNRMVDQLGMLEPIIKKPLALDKMEKLAEEFENKLRKSKPKGDEKKE